jgi:hypothetical protein
LVKSLIALFRFLLATRRVEKILAKNRKANLDQQPVVTFIVPETFGAFMNQDDMMLMARSDSIYVEDQDITMNIQYLCSCGLPVYELLGKDLEFGCRHCDTICQTKGCEQCKTLMSVDYGSEEGDEEL